MLFQRAPADMDHSALCLRTNQQRQTLLAHSPLRQYSLTLVFCLRSRPQNTPHLVLRDLLSEAERALPRRLGRLHMSGCVSATCPVYLLHHGY